jgi:hypothetical protein
MHSGRIAQSIAHRCLDCWPHVENAYSIETFAWDDGGDLLINTSNRCPERRVPTMIPTHTFSMTGSDGRATNLERSHDRPPNMDGKVVLS